MGAIPRVPGGAADDGGPAEHAFCEAFTETLGWTRLDPSAGTWPVAARDAVIHRFVEPPHGLDAEGELVPFETASPGLILERRPGRYDRWHQCRPVASVHLMEPGYLEVQGELASALEGATGGFIDADRWDPLVETSEPVEGAGALYVELERWRNSSQLVGY